MDTASLKAFIAVAELQSFSRAAEKMHLTQPAVSKRISALEQLLNAPLFDRVGRTICLTEAGRTLLPVAHTVLGQLEDCKDEIAALRYAVGGRLSVATSHHIGLHRLPSFLRHFTYQYPSVTLDLHFMDSEQACERVDAAELELAIVTLPETEYKNLELSPLWQDDLLFVCGKDQPLAQQQAPLSLSQLCEHPAILPAKGTVTRDILEAYMRANRAKTRTAIETNYLETIKMLVSVGMGWSLLPAIMIDKDIVALECEMEPLARQLGIAKHSKRIVSRAGSCFIAELEQYAQKP